MQIRPGTLTAVLVLNFAVAKGRCAAKGRTRKFRQPGTGTKNAQQDDWCVGGLNTTNNQPSSAFLCVSAPLRQSFSHPPIPSIVISLLHALIRVSSFTLRGDLE